MARQLRADKLKKRDKVRQIERQSLHASSKGVNKILGSDAFAYSMQLVVELIRRINT